MHHFVQLVHDLSLAAQVSPPPPPPPTRFTLFPQLPLELRLPIWESLLPTLGPAIYPYRKGCWNVGPLPPSHDTTNTNPHRRKHLIAFRPKHLGIACIDTPLRIINQETRRIALRWAAAAQQQQQQRRRQRKRRNPNRPANPFVLRSFRPNLDTLCVDPLNWAYWFVRDLERQGVEPWDALFLATWTTTRRRQRQQHHRIRRLAVTEQGLLAGATAAAEQMVDFCNLLVSFPLVDTLYVLCGDLRGLKTP